MSERRVRVGTPAGAMVTTVSGRPRARIRCARSSPGLSNAAPGDVTAQRIDPGRAIFIASYEAPHREWGFLTPRPHSPSDAEPISTVEPFRLK